MTRGRKGAQRDITYSIPHSNGELTSFIQYCMYKIRTVSLQKMIKMTISFCRAVRTVQPANNETRKN
jgi:hypothetical protein